MPGIDGLSAAAALAQEVPDCAVIILTTFGRAGYLRRAMEAGSRGFIVKDALPNGWPTPCDASLRASVSSIRSWRPRPLPAGRRR
jgi:DNA-binding NarL/FixJ family response regulator